MAKRIYGDPGTLYQRCGGVFGVASFVDRCMDLWMADKTLKYALRQLNPALSFLPRSLLKDAVSSLRVTATTSSSQPEVWIPALDEWR